MPETPRIMSQATMCPSCESFWVVFWKYFVRRENRWFARYLANRVSSEFLKIEFAVSLVTKIEYLAEKSRIGEKNLKIHAAVKILWSLAKLLRKNSIFYGSKIIKIVNYLKFENIQNFHCNFEVPKLFKNSNHIKFDYSSKILKNQNWKIEFIWKLKRAYFFTLHRSYVIFQARKYV